MRIQTLKIENIRGIKDTELSLGGSNLLLYGPNGAGKSAVVDALDLLLTGKISRLVGKGTGSIKLSEAGPHVDAGISTASVRATMAADPRQKPTTVVRRLQSPAKPEVDGPESVAAQRMLGAVRDSHHMLSRRHLLAFIAAEPQARGERIARLLNLTEIESHRKSLVGAANRAKREADGSARRVKDAESTLCATLDVEFFSEEGCLSKINTDRQILGGEPIDHLVADAFLSGISFSPPLQKKGYVDPDHLRRIAKVIADDIDAFKRKSDKLYSGIVSVLAELARDEELAYLLKRLRLFQMGLDLVPESGDCPLCDTDWPPGELKEHIRGHLHAAERAEDQQQQLRESLSKATELLQPLVSRAKQLAEAARGLGLAPEKTPLLIAWLDQAKVQLDFLSHSDSVLAASTARLEEVRALFEASSAWLAEGELIAVAAAARFPDGSKRQKAYTRLTTAKANLLALRSAQRQHQDDGQLWETLQKVSSAFEATRKDVLESLYRAIESRFNEFYRLLHQEDEADFAGRLSQTPSGVQMAVRFYGRGPFHPTAVHSEGHQDSMGLCLFLALTERLVAPRAKILVLDDVVMSVDAGHRRAVCELLKKEFSDWQIIITTHDRFWVRQLQSAGIVTRRNSLEFSNWSIETGPIVSVERELWSRVEEDLAAGDVSTASQRLRRSAEEFFETVCDRLQAPVPYRSERDYGLWDFAEAAQARLRSLSSSAIKVSRRWKRTEQAESVERFQRELSAVLGRTNSEKWLINKGVHFSLWGEMSPEDFRAVVQAWHDLFNIFLCPECRGILRVVALSSGRLSSLRCRCGDFSWNLMSPAKDGEEPVPEPLMNGEDSSEKGAAAPQATPPSEPSQVVDKHGQIGLFGGSASSSTNGQGTPK